MTSAFSYAGTPLDLIKEMTGKNRVRGGDPMRSFINKFTGLSLGHGNGTDTNMLIGM